jgi:nitroreductase
MPGVAQSMMLAAWAAGVGSCPNAGADHDVLVGPLGIGTQEQVAAVLTFGIPARPVEIGRHTTAARSARAARRSSSDVATYA